RREATCLPRTYPTRVGECPMRQMQTDTLPSGTQMMTEPVIGSADGVVAAEAMGAANTPIASAAAVVANTLVNLDISNPSIARGSTEFTDRLADLSVRRATGSAPDNER